MKNQRRSFVVRLFAAATLFLFTLPLVNCGRKGPLESAPSVFTTDHKEIKGNKPAH